MYTPPRAMLVRYADVLVRYALNGGKGMKKNDVVYVASQQPGLPLAKEVYRAVLERGGHPMVQILDDEFKLLHLQAGTDRQVGFFPAKFYRGIAGTIDHWVRIVADKDPMFLKECDPRKIILAGRSTKPFREWLDKKEDAGAFSWTLCLYGTAGTAAQAGLSLENYWKQIRQACFLDETDPVARWKTVAAHARRVIARLNRMRIERLHIQARDTDLWITVGEKRRWLGGSGRNIPSFEIFTSPDWRGTEGKIFFDLPLYRYGNSIRDVSLEFRGGKIVKATARKNEKLLHEMIKQKNADKTGEISFTDRRFSRITRFMADTLYDENFGGRYGNTHLAVGKSFHDTYDGDPGKMKKKEFERLGFNDSPEHTDIVATTDRKVTAYMKNGRSRVIYTHGEFTI